MRVDYLQLKSYLEKGGFSFQRKGNTAFCFKREEDEVIDDSGARIKAYYSFLEKMM